MIISLFNSPSLAVGILLNAGEFAVELNGQFSADPQTPPRCITALIACHPPRQVARSNVLDINLPEGTFCVSAADPDLL